MSIPRTPAAVEERLLGGPRRLCRRAVALSAGVSLLSVRKVWRALGLASVEDDEIAYTDADNQAVARIVGLVRRGVLDEVTAIACVRALGQTTDRLVSWQLEALVEQLCRPGDSGPGAAPAARSDGAGGRADGAAGGRSAAGLVLERIDDLADDLERLLVYAWRRKLAAAVAQLADGGEAPGSGSQELTVGFADLVSYTRLSQRLEQRELGELVQRFEGLAADVITAGRGRVVKNVGDEVLFTAEDPRSAAAIALSLSERMAVDDLIPDVRVGLAHGPVLRRLGDVYGPTVNLASRLTALAQPGTVVTDAATARALDGQRGLALIPQRRRQVRGFGQVQPLLIARSGPGAHAIFLD